MRVGGRRGRRTFEFVGTGASSWGGPLFGRERQRERAQKGKGEVERDTDDRSQVIK